MRIRDIMTAHPIYIEEDSTIRHAAEIISIAGVSDIMVINSSGDFIGVLSEGDLLRAVLPNFDEVIEAGGTLDAAFQFFVRKGFELAKYPITSLIIRQPIMLRLDDEAAQAATIMTEKQIRCLPVVENGKLVGSISRSDICRAVIFANRGES